MQQENLGENFIIQYVLSYTDSHANDENVKETLSQIYHKCILKEIEFEEAETQVFLLIKSMDSIERLKKIIEVSDDPLPCSGNPSKRSSKKNQMWETQEDIRLISGVLRFGVENWERVAEFVGNGRNRSQCSQRWFRCLSPTISKKSWNQSDDMKLRELVQTYGAKNWVKIASLFGNRSDIQVRYRWRQLEKTSEIYDCQDKIKFTQRIQKLETSHTMFDCQIPDSPKLIISYSAIGFDFL